MRDYDLPGGGGILPRVFGHPYRPPVSIAFADKLRIEQLRAIEEDGGPLPLPEPPAARGPLLVWLDERSRILARQGEVHSAISQGPRLYRWGLTALLTLFALIGASASFNALAGGSTLNIFWILGVLLGFHWLSLLIWTLLTLFVPSSEGGLVAPAFNRLMHWLLPSRGRASKTRSANRAFLQTAFAPDLARWHFGQVTHLVWASYLAGGFLALVLLLATRQFDFVWESTLLGGDAFVSLSRALAAPLEAVGWPVPGEAQILASQTGAAPPDPVTTRRTWALFLLGCILLYGLLPRLAAWLICIAQLKRAQRRFTLPLTEPYYLRLQQLLWPSSRAGRVLDADIQPGQSAGGAAKSEGHQGLPDNTLWLGLELSPAELRPGLVAPDRLVGNIVDAASLQQALISLGDKHNDPVAIAVPVNKPADRGLQRTLRELVKARSPECLWLVLVADKPVSAAKLQSWAKAVAQAGLLPTQVVTRVEAS